MNDKVKGVAAAMAAIAALAIGGVAIAGAAGNDNSASGSSATEQPTAEQPSSSHSSEPAESKEANEGPDQAIGGSALDQASAAALAHTGGGQVTDTEVGDEESYYEVEVQRDDGTQVDVQLDRDFNVVGGEIDEE